MEHKGTVLLETKRLILRRFEITDAKDMFENWASDPEVTKYLTWPTHENIDVSRYVVNDWVSSYGNDNYYSWAIELKEDKKVVGTIAAVKVNDIVGAIEIGYCIGRNYWGKGITAEAGKAVTKFFFEEVKANRVCAYHAPENPNSGKVMKKIGMTYEGTLRQSDICNQGVVDAAVYSILKEEYFERKGD